MKRKWKKKNGTKVWIKDMDDDHLLNTLKLCHRYAWKAWNVSQFELTRALMSLSSDESLDSIDREMSRGRWEHLPNSYWDILRYAQKRAFWTPKLSKKFTVTEYPDVPQFNYMSPYWATST